MAHFPNLAHQDPMMFWTWKFKTICPQASQTTVYWKRISVFYKFISTKLCLHSQYILRSVHFQKQSSTSRKIFSWPRCAHGLKEDFTGNHVRKVEDCFWKCTDLRIYWFYKPYDACTLGRGKEFCFVRPKFQSVKV